MKVLVGYGSDTFAASPSFGDIGPLGHNIVSAVRTKRGRSYVTDRMDAGSCEVDFYDQAGVLDPTLISGPFYPMDPNCPAQVWLYNPVAASYQQIFGGYVESLPSTVRSQNAAMNQGTLDIVDLFALLANREVPVGLDFAAQTAGSYTAVSAGNSNGNTTYQAQNVDDRIRAILADTGVPSGMTSIFTGNVSVLYTVYSPAYQILAALQDAADAEFPSVANIYMDKTGKFTFHGRKARFDYTNPTYGITVWQVGDAAAVAGNTSMAILAQDGLTIDRDVTKVINNYLAYPDTALPAQIYGTPTNYTGSFWEAGQLIYDAASITQNGPRGLSAINLLTAGGLTDGNNGNQETLLFAKWWVENFSTPQTKVQQAKFTQINPRNSNAAAHYSMMNNIELNDVLEITASTPDGAGFSADLYFVEGLSYDIGPGGGMYNGQQQPAVTLTVDLSPVAYYNTDPFS